MLHYDVDPSHNAMGTKIELSDSTISETSDALLMKCAMKAHRGFAMQLEHKYTASKHYWATQIKFPLERDNAYLFFTK